MLDATDARLIANPAAAGGKVGRRWSEIAPRLRAMLGPIEMRLTERPGHAATLARQAVEDGKHIILSLGGDGTHNEVVNGIMAASPPPGEVALGILPSGTGGDFRRMLAIENDIHDAARVIANTPPSPADVGHVSFQSHEGEASSLYFINIASFGMGGLVDQYVNASRKRLGGRVSFFLATLKALKAYRPARVRLIADGVDRGTFDIMNVAVANGRYFGGGMLVAPDAAVCDGRLEVVVMSPAGPVATVRTAAAVYRGTHVAEPHVTVFQARELVAELVGNDPAYLDIDGEAPGVVPATFAVRPHAIKLYGLPG